jgi:hypothetical protein
LNGTAIDHAAASSRELHTATSNTASATAASNIDTTPAISASCD